MIAVQTTHQTVERSCLLAAMDLVTGLLGTSVICELCWAVRAPNDSVDLLEREENSVKGVVTRTVMKKVMLGG